MKLKLYDPFQYWQSSGVIWVFSDPHFNDPESKLMNPNWPDAETIVKNINAKVGKRDTLIILGDIGDVSYVAKLKGYKVLITGNHDKGVTTYERKVETIKVPFKLTKEEQKTIDDIQINYGPIDGPGAYCDMVSIQQKYTDKIAVNLFKEVTKDWRDHAYLIHDEDNTVQYDYDEETDSWYINIRKDNQLFDEVYDGPVFISSKILLSHEPIKLPFGINIHGHVHKGEEYIYTPGVNVSINMCSDVRNFEPMRLTDIIERFKVQELHRTTIDKAVENKTKKGK